MYTQRLKTILTVGCFCGTIAGLVGCSRSAGNAEATVAVAPAPADPRIQQISSQRAQGAAADAARAAAARAKK